MIILPMHYLYHSFKNQKFSTLRIKMTQTNQMMKSNQIRYHKMPLPKKVRSVVDITKLPDSPSRSVLKACDALTKEDKLLWDTKMFAKLYAGGQDTSSDRSSWVSVE